MAAYGGMQKLPEKETMRRFTSVRDKCRTAAWGSIFVGGLVRF